jgi:flagellar protein FliS
MSYAQKATNAVDEYARLGLRTDVETASPHRLILLLLDGALDKLRAARLALNRNDVAAKGANISWAMSIIDGLRASLNLERGGDIAANLDRLYDYMTRTLVEANLRNDGARIDEVSALLRELRAGWKGVESRVGEPRCAHNDIGSTALVLG